MSCHHQLYELQSFVYKFEIVMSYHDTLQRFLFENAAMRGNIVQLDASWQAILNHHDYPEIVRDSLGQMLVASILLSATLKYNSRIIMQIQGDGVIPMMVTECTSERAIRAIAHFDESLAENSTNKKLNELVGNGKLVITLEPQQGYERYQSIVELTGETLADALMHYLESSEQLDTRLFLFASNQYAAGLLVQKLPEESSSDKDAWERIGILSETISAEEILQLSPQDVIHRLYHEEDIRVFESEPVFFRCSCSKERVANMLQTIGYEEVKNILEEQGEIDVACEFCNHKYSFDAIDIEQLFVSATTHDTPSTKQ